MKVRACASRHADDCEQYGSVALQARHIRRGRDAASFACTVPARTRTHPPSAHWHWQAGTTSQRQWPLAARASAPVVAATWTLGFAAAAAVEPEPGWRPGVRPGVTGQFPDKRGLRPPDGAGADSDGPRSLCGVEPSLKVSRAVALGRRLICLPDSAAATRTSQVQAASRIKTRVHSRTQVTFELPPHGPWCYILTCHDRASSRDIAA